MSDPASPEAHKCAICNQSVGEARTVPTSDGDVVHIACAEREAAQAHRQRTIWSVGSAALLLALLVGTIGVGVGVPALFVLLVLVAVAHGVLNQRWWLHRLPRRRLSRRR